jgi:HD superfamily phosphodiesterase
MRVFQFAEKIVRDEVKTLPIISDQRAVIQAAAILHDTCDKKYRNVEDGLSEINDLLSPLMHSEKVDATLRIINSMSYSKMKTIGFPDMGEYQTAFNVVREADLLDAYDFDRSMIYHMRTKNANLEQAYEDAECIFNQRILRYYSDGLFLTQYGKTEAPLLHIQAVEKMTHWRHIIYDSSLSDDLII